MISTKVRTSISAWVVAVMTISMVVAAPGTPVARITSAGLISDLAVAARAADATQLAAALEGLSRAERSATPLTEGGAVKLFRSLGFTVTTSHPDRRLTSQQADALIADALEALSPRPDSPGVAVGLRPVPASINDCLADKNHGACVDCCKEVGGGASTCSKMCMVINKGSSSEPLP